MDGYTALRAYVPPIERRGLVLVDPPFEGTDEFGRLAGGIGTAWARWPGGVYLLWYPLKDMEAAKRFGARLAASGIRRVLRIELDVGRDPTQGGLAACGLIVVNPPHVLEDEARVLMPWLTRLLARTPEAGWRMDRLSGE
jgi:23S rRNA (adenine2030-N6)-methyltransferase